MKCSKKVVLFSVAIDSGAFYTKGSTKEIFMQSARRPLEASEKSYIIEARIRDVPVSHVLAGLPGRPDDQRGQPRGWQPEINPFGEQVIIVGAKLH